MHHRTVLVRTLLVSVAGVVLSLGAGFCADTEDTEALPTPTFKDEVATATFKEGREHFTDGSYKEAQKCFRSSRSATDKAGKKIVDGWIDACKGGLKLADVEKAVAKESWRSAWDKLAKVEKKYGETPLRERLDMLGDMIARELFLPLATFEEEPPEPEKNAGNRPNTAEIVTDEKYVSEGKRSLKWREEVGLGSGKLLGWLNLAKFEGGALDQYRYLSLSILSEDKDFGKFTIFVDTGEDDEEWARNPMKVLQSNCYYHHLTINKPGWRRVRIDLRKDLSSTQKPELAEMQRLSLIIIPPSKPKTIYIDDVKLEK